MPKWALFSTLLVMTSCGGFRLFSGKTLEQEREIASVAMERLVIEENKTFGADIDEKLGGLYNYYAIAHRNLYAFDESIPELPLEDIYQSSPYLKLIAVRTQVDEIENELIELSKNADEKSKPEIQRIHILKERVKAFSQKSPLSSLAMSNLGSLIGIKLRNGVATSRQEILEEIKNLEANKEFQIYEKNIDHLSNLLESDLKSSAKKFRPSETEVGNISGQEFPPKVWALTFDNGPHKRFTSEILKNLKVKNLKATFFQLGKQLENNKEVGLQVKKAQMEIGSNSFSHQELTKMGLLNLEKEIDLSTRTMEEKLNVDIKFFRLPYGSGIQVPSIRQQIAKNNLIHAYWNVDTLDWLAQHPDRIINRTKKLMKKTPRDSGIILFHDVHKRSVIASLEIMDFLKKDGRRTCTLGDIIEDMNQGRKSVCSKKSF